MTAYYNENDPYAAEWLRALIAAGHIAPGVVDQRDIRDVEAYELATFTQCHFFAGIGVWSYALRRAGWSDGRPIWTGSCPCQPFSQAGKRKGTDDERHLWPDWFRLIRECRPATVVGEQVASAHAWLDLVSSDLEREGFAFGASDLCAAGFGGAHIRQRYYFFGLADLVGSGLERRDRRTLGLQCAPAERGRSLSRLADVYGRDASAERQQRGREYGQLSANGGVAEDRPAHAPMLGRDAVDWLYCRDARWRPVEPGTFPLVDAAPARVGRLRAYGNALDAETATNFCGAVREICDALRPVIEYDL